MVLGYAVILGLMAVFIASLVVRYRNLSRDRQVLEESEAGHPTEVAAS
jgi:hypothetical protein